MELFRNLFVPLQTVKPTLNIMQTKRRLFTVLVAAVAALAASATDYTDKLVVKVNDDVSQMDATISLTEHDGLYDINLKNFVMKSGESEMPVGNVEIKDIKPELAGNAVFIRAFENIVITNGDDSYPVWMGPMLGALPVSITAVVEGGKLRALIDLDLSETLQQIIEARFGEGLVEGTGYHIPNPDFEQWRTIGPGEEEPIGWHSFGSAYGSFASMTGHHLEKSDEGIGGSTCARIYSSSIFGIIANGTLTTGRLKANSMSATSPENCSVLDIKMKDLDGTPFYVPLESRPDSLTLWVKFKQGNHNAEHPYATVSAVITDGTYYQEPQDKEYTNVVARAENNKIAENNGEWQRLSIPFVYADNSLEPKAIMVTVATNADPGQGSDGDEVFIDDVALVYNSQLSSMNVDGFAPDTYTYEVDEDMLDNLTCQADGKGAYILKSIAEKEGTKEAEIKVYSGDLRSITTYLVSVKTSAGIKDIESSANAECTYYSLNGQRVSSPKAGQVYILRKVSADGSVSYKKILK